MEDYFFFQASERIASCAREKWGDVIVGHVLFMLSRVFHLFLTNGGEISVTVAGKYKNKGIGLEIPATYFQYHKKPFKLIMKKLREQLKTVKKQEERDD